MAAFLVKDSDGEQYELGSSCVIGRSPGADVVLDDGSVSREHAMIRKGEGGYSLYDLDSANGCLINGAAVTQPTGLRHGDVVMIAEVMFRFQGEDEDPTRDDVVDAGIGSQTVMMSRVEKTPMILLVSDIMGYTSLSEQVMAEQVASVLRSWYDHCRSVLEEEGGATIDKFIGDAVFAYWPATDTAARERAVEAARRLRDSRNYLSDMHQKMLSDVGNPFRCGVGLHIGEAAVGAMSRGMQTALGDAVNVAFRVEGLTREVDNDVVATGGFVEGWAEGRELFESCGKFQVKGLLRAVEILALRAVSD
ncbi:MAG: adenylate/guanylate cyclase domain-containing protein [Verrucomicrobiota bacterium]